MFLFCGEIDVVVVHVDGHEKIVATTSWIEPGKTMEPTLLQLSRMRLFRIWKAWGMGPFKVRPIDSRRCCVAHIPPQRMVADYVPRTEKVAEVAFQARGKSPKDAWHLVNVCTDPDYEGRGRCTSSVRARISHIPQVTRL